MNARRTPQRVFAAHLANQLPNFLGHRRTPGLAVTDFSRPEQLKRLAVPADHHLRFHDDEGGPPTAPKLGQLSPQEAIGASQLWSLHRPLQYTELVSQGKDLELKGRSRTEHRQKRGKQCGGNEGWGESSKEGQLRIYQPNRNFREPAFQAISQRSELDDYSPARPGS